MGIIDTVTIIAYPDWTTSISKLYNKAEQSSYVSICPLPMTVFSNCSIPCSIPCYGRQNSQISFIRTEDNDLISLTKPPPEQDVGCSATKPDYFVPETRRLDHLAPRSSGLRIEFHLGRYQGDRSNLIFQVLPSLARSRVDLENGRKSQEDSQFYKNLAT